MTEYWVINGHQPNCAYLRLLHDLDGDEPCDCEPDDNDEYGDEDDDGW